MFKGERGHVRDKSMTLWIVTISRIFDFVEILIILYIL